MVGLGLSMGLSLVHGGGGGPSPVTLRAAAWDDFNTGGGTLNGRMAAGNAYQTVLLSTPGGSTLNALQVTATGTGQLHGSSAQSRAHGFRVPTTVRDFGVFVLAGTGKFYPHVDAGGSGRTAISLTANANTNFVITSVINDVAGSSNNVLMMKPQAGDVISLQTIADGGVDYLYVTANGLPLTSTLLVNGRFNITAAGIPLTGRMGVAGETSPGYEAFTGGDPAVIDQISPVQYGRVVQAETGATVSTHTKFTYTGPAPAAVKYRIYNAADNSLVTSGDATIVSAADGVCEVSGIDYTLPLVTTQHWQEVYRTDAVDGDGNPAEISGRGPYRLLGLIMGSDGQSLNTLADTGVSTVAVPNTNCWTISVSSNTFGALGKTASNTTVSAYMAVLGQVVGSTTPMQYIAAGVGSTSITVRGLGSTNAALTDEAVLASGGKARLWHHVDGQNDVGDLATYKAALTALYADRQARWGLEAVIMFPLAGMYGYNDVQVEAIRRYQAFELPATDPLYKAGPFTLDLQHRTVAGVLDTLHLDAGGFTEQMRRGSYCAANALDPVAVPDAMRGPRAISAARIDAQTVDVTFQCDAGAAGMEAINTSYTTNKTDVFDCGLRFGTAVGTPSGATSRTITTPVSATGVSVGAMDGNQVVVRFTFAAGAFPGTAYIGGPYGANPFNRANDDTVNRNMATMASILRETFADGTAVAVQPIWRAGGDDFLAAS